MRELTPAEVRAIGALLAYPRASELERIRRSGLPTSTYHVVKRRAYDEGWLTDRWVPEPAAFGLAGVRLALLRPLSSDRPKVESLLRQDPGCVLLWSGVHVVLAALFLPPGPTRDSLPPLSPRDRAGSSVLEIAPGHGCLPVYFDFAGAWSRFASTPRPETYPSGLDLEIGPTDPRTLAAARRVLREQPAPERREGRFRWTNLLRLPRSERRAFDGGLLQPRVLPSLSKLPPFGGRRLGEVVLISARLRHGGVLVDVVNDLVARCKVAPFLAAEADGNVLLGALGQTSAHHPGRVPVRAAEHAVLPTLKRWLDRIDIVIEPVESLREVVPHRYESCLGGAAAGEGGEPGAELASSDHRRGRGAI